MLIEPVIRPPSEANSFLLQVTLGCSQNSCKFCGAYVDKPFRIKKIDEIEIDIKLGAMMHPETNKVFLCDGDALALNNKQLVPILQKLSSAFPKLGRITSYANAHNILSKTPEELKELYDNKLKLIFLGLESGDPALLKRMKKRAAPEEMIEAVQKAKAAGIKSHVIVLLGLGERTKSREHALATAKAVNAMQPKYLSALSLMLVPGTELYAEHRAGKFTELTPQELLQETYWLMEELKLDSTIFFCNHASNYLPLEGRLPNDQGKMLNILQTAINGEIGLKPEGLRGL